MTTRFPSLPPCLPRLFLGATALLCTACATPSTLLVNDRGDGHRCAASGYGVYGTLAAGQIHKACVADYRKAGFVELPPVESGFLLRQGTMQIGSFTHHQSAAPSGLLVGDTVVRIDGVWMWRLTDIMRVLQGKHAGDILQVTVRRAEQELTVPVMVQPRGA